MSTTIETATGTSQTMVLNMGPQHPSTHGVLRVMLELDGEMVVKAESVIGYLHTGIEKSLESKTYSQGITLTDRVDYLAPLSNNLGYCLAVEKILGLRSSKARAVHPRAAGGADSRRIAPGLAGNARHRPGRDDGVSLQLPRARRDPEDFRVSIRPADDDQLFPRLAGLRWNRRRIGWSACSASSITCRRTSTNTRRCSPRTRSGWRARWTSERCPRTTRLRWAAPVPLLRASGVPYDVRKAFPYSSYEEFDFNVQTQTAGDCYARYQVRVAEIRESLKIVKQAMAKIPAEGPFRAELPGHHPAVARGNEGVDRRPDLPLQNFHRGFCAAAGRSLSGDRIAARRAGLFRRERWLAQALPRENADAVVS